jgi:hypothetical protein
MNLLRTPTCNVFGIRYSTVRVRLGGMHGIVIQPDRQGVGRLHKVTPVKIIFDRLVREALGLLDRFSTISTHRHGRAK